MKVPILTITCLLFIAFLAPATRAQTKIYRGAIGNSHFQMKLDFNGSEVSGTYAYDNVGQELKLTGKLDSQGHLELKEFAKGKQQTGKFSCKRKLDDPIDPECSWSRADGTRESMATFEEQHIDLPGGMQITPTLMNNRRTGVGVSYPQIFTKSVPSTGVLNFNRRILAMVKKAVAEFDPVDGKGSFDANYNVLFASQDLISVELSVYYDGGGAHPNNYYLSLVYDLKADKEIKFEDNFQADKDYQSAIAKYLVTDITKRAADIEQRDTGQPTKRDEPIISEDQLTEVSGWGLTPKGLVIYFDFPHVIAAFDKNVVPYSVVKAYLKSDSPAAKFQ